MNEREPPSSLNDLEARLEKARAAANPPEGGETGSSRAEGLSAGFQVATELVVAMVVAIAIGWFLDQWLETGPLFLLVFALLGAAAGALNVYRRAQKMVGVGGVGSDRKEDGFSAKAPEKED